MTPDTLVRALVAWIVHAYSDNRVPTNVLARTFGDELGVAPKELDAAVSAAIARGFIHRDGKVTDGIVVSVTPLGREFAEKLLCTINGVSTNLNTAATEVMKQVVGVFQECVTADAKDLATKSGRKHIEPLHVILAAKTLVAGRLATGIDEIDRKRDKKSDRDAEDSLLRMLFDPESKS